MHPKIYIADSYIPTYLIFAVIGFMISLFFLEHILVKHLIFKKYISVYLYSIAGMLLGAKIFGFISRLFGIYVSEGIWKWGYCFKKSGIVYLGGLLGYLGMIRILCCFKNREWKEICNITALIIPLFHAFGRIGCYFGGCCYGKKSTSFLALPYRNTLFPDNFENRIPVQLMECLVEIFLFILCYIWYKKKEEQDNLRDCHILQGYLLLYSIWRFIIEFWRDDKIRGVFGLISFSQIVSILIIGFVLTIVCRERRKL